MRSISTSLKKKLASRIQAGENAMSASLWVSRPTTPLTEDRFLEKQSVIPSSNIVKTSIAVCHPHLMRGASEVYIGYLESGVIKVAKTNYVEEMERHQWTKDIGYSQEADDFCLCFNGSMPKAPNGKVEFKTEQLPWVFWVLDGVLYGRKLLDESEPFIIAESNCSTVSAVRAMWSSAGGFDFGLVVFFLLNGQLYYRQLIDNEWMDAEIVSFGPVGIRWSEIAAFRTWDYRIGIQGKTTEGVCYEMFTQFMGIGKQNTEHVQVKDVNAKSDLIEIKYDDGQENEHIELSSVSAGAPYGGLYSLDMPILISACNVEDNNGDWGTTVVVEFSNYLVAEQVASNNLQFTLVDSWGSTYYPNSARLNVEDGKTVTLIFEDFNSAHDVCEIQYTPGTVYSMATVLMQFTSISFKPQNLKPPAVPQPEVESIWNMNSQGTEIAIKFTEAITENPAGNEERFTVVTQEYDMVPGGTLHNHTKTVVGAKWYAGTEQVIDLSTGSGSGISSSNGELSLEVLSDG